MDFFFFSSSRTACFASTCTSRTFFASSSFSSSAALWPERSSRNAAISTNDSPSDCWIDWKSSMSWKNCSRLSPSASWVSDMSSISRVRRRSCASDASARHLRIYLHDRLLLFGDIALELGKLHITLFDVELSDAYFVVEYFDVALKRR